MEAVGGGVGVHLGLVGEMLGLISGELVENR